MCNYFLNKFVANLTHSLRDYAIAREPYGLLPVAPATGLTILIVVFNKINHLSVRFFYRSFPLIRVTRN